MNYVQDISVGTKTCYPGFWISISFWRLYYVIPECCGWGNRIWTDSDSFLNEDGAAGRKSTRAKIEEEHMTKYEIEKKKELIQHVNYI